MYDGFCLSSVLEVSCEYVESVLQRYVGHTIVDFKSIRDELEGLSKLDKRGLNPNEKPPLREQLVANLIVEFVKEEGTPAVLPASHAMPRWLQVAMKLRCGPRGSNKSHGYNVYPASKPRRDVTALLAHWSVTAILQPRLLEPPAASATGLVHVLIPLLMRYSPDLDAPEPKRARRQPATPPPAPSTSEHAESCVAYSWGDVNTVFAQP